MRIDAIEGIPRTPIHRLILSLQRFVYWGYFWGYSGGPKHLFLLGKPVCSVA